MLKKFSWHFILIWVIRIIIFVNLFYYILIKNNYFLLISIVAFTLTFLPNLFCKIFKRKMDNILSLSIVIFIFISLYLGTLKNFYSFIWWDTMLHVFSGLILGLLSLSLMYYLNGRNINLNSIFIAIYMLSFAALGGILWEVYEFTIDNLFNMDMQGVSFSGVTDTMEDFIADLVGGFISSIYGYIKFKK